MEMYRLLLFRLLIIKNKIKIMGILDSNSFIPKAKVITVSSKTVENDYYITDGLINVSSYNYATLKITGIGSSNTAKSVGSTVNSSPVEIKNVKDFRFTSHGNASIIKYSGNFVVDLTNLSWWGLKSIGSGTYSVTITLTNKVHSTDNLLSEVYDGTLDGSVSNIFYIVDIGRAYTTAALEVRLSDESNPTNLQVYLRDAENGIYFNTHPIRDVYGNILSKITKSGMYYIDVTGCDTLQVRNSVQNQGAGNAKLVFTKGSMPVDYKPIQLLETSEITLVGGESNIILDFGYNYLVYKYFKFNRFEIEYTGSQIPNLDVYIARRYSNNNYGAFKKIYSVTEFKDVIDWTMAVGDQFVLKLQPSGTFIPNNGDSIKVTLYGMR